LFSKDLLNEIAQFDVREADDIEWAVNPTKEYRRQAAH
jgi:hypothetical protein